MESKNGDDDIISSIIAKLAAMRVWFRQTLIVIGLITVFLTFNGAKLFGYYVDFALIPIKLTQSR